jgi:hypothetical protein
VLSEDQIQTATELRLRMAGICVLNKVKWANSPQSASLKVRLSVIQILSEPVYGYHMAVTFFRPVTLTRTPAVSVDA